MSGLVHDPYETDPYETEDAVTIPIPLAAVEHISTPELLQRLAVEPQRLMLGTHDLGTWRVESIRASVRQHGPTEYLIELLRIEETGR